ncbi:MAG: putative cytokinetic ring protein SteA [Nocardioidaceae bacterium]|nr:putative cytokinetic ring protein SteA [Nocardioidaceae bacterium]
MKLPNLRRPAAPAAGGTSGTVRMDRRTKNLTKRLKPGDVAVIDHVDLDRESAETLVRCRVAAVVNASSSTSGRYPNLGPEVIAAAGIPLVDRVGSGVFGTLSEGDRVTIDADGVVSRSDGSKVSGDVLDVHRAAALKSEARAGMTTQLESFTVNATEHLRREQELLLDGVGVPELHTRIEGRPVVLVTAGHGHARDLHALRHYLSEHRPVLIGVEGGADVLLEADLKPDVVVGHLDALSDRALRCGAEVVEQTGRTGRTTDAERLERLGVDVLRFGAGGAAEDLAMILADDRGARIIVTVGIHANLVEYLDGGRSSSASTFLARLRVGSKLIDAQAVAAVHRPRVGLPMLLLLLLAAAVALVLALSTTPVGSDWLEPVTSGLGALVDRIQELLP